MRLGDAKIFSERNYQDSVRVCELITNGPARFHPASLRFHERTSGVF